MKKYKNTILQKYKNTKLQNYKTFNNLANLVKKIASTFNNINKHLNKYLYVTVQETKSDNHF